MHFDLLDIAVLSMDGIDRSQDRAQ